MMLYTSNTWCPKRNIPIGSAKSQFLRQTSEIAVVARLFHSGFRAFFGFEKFLIFNDPNQRSKFSKFCI